MAVVDRVIPLPKIGFSATMPRYYGFKSELAMPAFEDKIYAAVGKDVKYGKAMLDWAVHQQGFNVKICLIHVLVPSQRIPMGGLGARIPVDSVNEIMLREHRENERINMHKILDTYTGFCREMGVQAEKEYIESDNVGKGIVQLIHLHGIKKLVMGAATSTRRKKITEIESRKAIFVRDEAHNSCQIWFIHNGHLVQTREARMVQDVAEAPTSAPWTMTLTPGARRLVLSRSQSATLRRNSTTNLSNLVLRTLRRAFSCYTDRTDQSPLSNNSLDMNENDAREMPEKRVTTCAEEEVAMIEGKRTDPKKRKYLQRLDTEKLEEEHEKEQDQLHRVMEDLRKTRDQKLLLESRFVETNQSRKELELKIISLNETSQTLQINLNNVLQEAEEVSRRQGDSSGTNYCEFSITEITEATQNFDPSLMIGQGGCGSMYRGFLRHTSVAIKIMKFQSMQGSQKFQQEVRVLSKVRHPNLLTLIGACPEPWTLVYEYVENGSLEDWLGSNNRAQQLSWRARIRIARELCSVLAFLHSCKPHCIVHGNVKPGNILLDKHLVSKLSDFGTCRLMSCGERSSNNSTIAHQTDPKGMLGYLDPEFLVTRELTPKSDVYSFGIILLQLLTRRPALGIAMNVQRAIGAGTLDAILDPLAGEWPYLLADELTRLALSCCKTSGRNRPDLPSDVWTALQSIGDFYR